jgi:hypothetical protein
VRLGLGSTLRRIEYYGRLDCRPMADRGSSTDVRVLETRLVWVPSD